MTPQRLEELRLAAERATPGQWSRSGSRSKVERADSHSVTAVVDGKEIVIATVWYDPRTHEGFHDACFIALFNPATALELVEVLAEVRGALEAMVDAEVDYMTRNLLGDPEKQHNVIRARQALSAFLLREGNQEDRSGE